jgi:hypothetical protein
MMRDDRFPRTAVIIDEENDAEEMEVQASFREAALIVSYNRPQSDLSKVADAEPWLRIRFGDDLYVSCDVTEIPDEDDQA